MDKRKLHYCLFCEKEVKRFYQHAIRNHKNEDRVKSILAIEDKKKRYWEWKLVAQQGDDIYNKTICRTPGDIKMVMKTKIPSAKKKYFTCTKCFGRIRTISKWKHNKKCFSQFFDVEEDPEIVEKIPAVTSDLLKSPFLSTFVSTLSEEKGREDNSLKTTVADLLTLEKHLGEQAKDEKPLVQYLTSANVGGIIKIIKCLGGEEKINSNVLFRYPWKALRFCRLVKKLGKFLTITYYKRNRDNEAREVKKFLTLFEEESNMFIMKMARRSIKLKKRTQELKLPMTTNIMEVTKYLQDETPKLLQLLKANKRERDWRQLAENLLCRITIFNRRRGGAVEKMTVEQFVKRSRTPETVTEEAMYNLTEEENEFLNSVKIIDIVHKCDNVVPIYITNDVEKAMETLLEFRTCGNIRPGNDYFFAASKKSLNPIRGVRVVEKYRKILPEEIQQIFTATNLRKHGATTSKVLDLSQQDAEDWASHMGHTLVIHKRYYRQRENIESILKIGRLLKALNEGTLKYFKGRQLKELPLTSVSDSEIKSPVKEPPNEQNNKDQ